uniref:Coiled-coil domain-containing protein 134-like n=2 Tax=Hirondellea gigas TaxID=1518452 RepID=A0A6A7G0P0_9CRUS
MFEERRQEHKSAVKSLLAMDDYQKQHKMITLTLERVHQVLKMSQEKLQQGHYVPGDPFPLDNSVRDALSQTMETTCLLGEVLLHLPDITRNVLEKLGTNKGLLAWGVFFTAHTTFLSDSTKKLVHLMEQELGLVDRDHDYVNPYSKSNKQKAKQYKQPQPKKKKKKSFKRGPSLSRHYDEL